MRTAKLVRATGVLLALAGAAWADLPEPTYLGANDLQPGIDQTLHVQLWRGTARDAKAVEWPAGGVPRLFVRSSDTQENRHDVAPERAGDNGVGVQILHAGLTLIGVDQRPAIGTATGAELRASQRHATATGDSPAGAASVGLPAERETVNVRHINAAKLLVRTPESRTASPIATGKTAQAAEIRPLADPTVMPVGSDLPVRIYIMGDKITGAEVTATCVSSGETQTFVTDAVGSGHFRVSAAGLWRVEFRALRPVADGDDVKWELYTGTLSFEVRKGADQ